MKISISQPQFSQRLVPLTLLGSALSLTVNSALAKPDVKTHAHSSMTMPMGKTMNKSKESEFAKSMMKSMEVMNKDMMAAPMTGNPDHDFVSMMIPHHQGAVEMAKIELRYGKDPVLRRLAQNIITNQNKEISMMKRAMAAFPTVNKAPRHK